jgi:hypothetical protein
MGFGNFPDGLITPIANRLVRASIFLANSQFSVIFDFYEL